MRIDGSPVTLAEFLCSMEAAGPLEVSPDALERIAEAHSRVRELAAGPEPIYGLNTGLGANLEHRIAPEDIPAFQLQIVAGRAMACGHPLPESIGRGVLLARILSAAGGQSGMSPGLFQHLCALYRPGLSPVVPEYGSVGASDLLQNATLGMAVCGEGQVWEDGEIRDAAEVFAERGIEVPDLGPKDGLALISHSGTSVALTAMALDEAGHAMEALKAAAVLSFEGYRANRRIFDAEINALRASPEQAEMAAWFHKALEGSETEARRIQDALSFRTIAPVYGTAAGTLARAIDVFEGELNGSSDSPVVLPEGDMLSTPNFLTPGLALAIEAVSLAFVGVAQSSVQRMQRLMTPALSGLPRFLSPAGAASAGFAPSQKVAASFFADIKSAAIPVLPDGAPTAEGVEDIVATTPDSARKLLRQTKPLHLLAGLEAVVAAQAVDLSDEVRPGPFAARLHSEMRKRVEFKERDQSLGDDVAHAVKVLRGFRT